MAWNIAEGYADYNEYFKAFDDIVAGHVKNGDWEEIIIKKMHLPDVLAISTTGYTYVMQKCQKRDLSKVYIPENRYRCQGTVKLRPAGRVNLHKEEKLHVFGCPSHRRHPIWRHNVGRGRGKGQTRISPRPGGPAPAHRFLTSLMPQRLAAAPACACKCTSQTFIILCLYVCSMYKINGYRAAI